jgi:hypothetical protein
MDITGTSFARHIPSIARPVAEVPAVQITPSCPSSAICFKNANGVIVFTKEPEYSSKFTSSGRMTQ